MGKLRLKIFLRKEGGSFYALSEYPCADNNRFLRSARILGEPAFKSQERKVVESRFSNPRTTHTVVDTRDPEVYHIRNQTTDQWLSAVVRVRRRPTSNAFF